MDKTLGKAAAVAWTVLNFRAATKNRIAKVCKGSYHMVQGTARIIAWIISRGVFVVQQQKAQIRGKYPLKLTKPTEITRHQEGRAAREVDQPSHCRMQ